MRWVWMAMELGVLCALGCTTRSVPQHYPRTSAASPDAPLGRPLRVSTSLVDTQPAPCAQCAARDEAANAQGEHGPEGHGAPHEAH